MANAGTAGPSQDRRSSRHKPEIHIVFADPSGQGKQQDKGVFEGESNKARQTASGAAREEETVMYELSKEQQEEESRFGIGGKEREEGKEDRGSKERKNSKERGNSKDGKTRRGSEGKTYEIVLSVPQGGKKPKKRRPRPRPRRHGEDEDEEGSESDSDSDHLRPESSRLSDRSDRSDVSNASSVSQDQ